MKRLPGANNSMNSSVSRGVRGNAALRLHAHSLDSATQEQYPYFVVEPRARRGTIFLFHRRLEVCAPPNEAIFARDHTCPHSETPISLWNRAFAAGLYSF